MADTYTDNLGLRKPDPQSVVNVKTINDNYDLIDADSAHGNAVWSNIPTTPGVITHPDFPPQFAINNGIIYYRGGISAEGLDTDVDRKISSLNVYTRPSKGDVFQVAPCSAPNLAGLWMFRGAASSIELRLGPNKGGFYFLDGVSYHV